MRCANSAAVTPLSGAGKAQGLPVGQRLEPHDPVRDPEPVLGGGAVRFSTAEIDDVDFDSTELARQLGPALRTRQPPEQKTLAEYGARLVDECRRALSIVLPFTDAERAFLDLLLDRGEVDASILTSDMTLRERIQAQPLLECKALNVRRHRGLS